MFNYVLQCTLGLTLFQSHVAGERCQQIKLITTYQLILTQNNQIIISNWLHFTLKITLIRPIRKETLLHSTIMTRLDKMAQ